MQPHNKQRKQKKASSSKSSPPCAPVWCMPMKLSSRPCPNMAGMSERPTASSGATALMSAPALRFTLARISFSASFSITCKEARTATLYINKTVVQAH